MDIDLYTRVIKKIHDNYIIGELNDGRVPQISLHDWGEPTLHPLLPEFISIARNYGCDVGFSSNFNTAPDWERIILSGPNVIKVSLSSLNENDYALTHRRGKLDKLLKNLETVVKLRDDLKPEIEIRMNYHVYAHNLKEDFDRVLEFCRQRNIVFSPEIAIFMPIEKVIKFREDTDENKFLPNDEDKKIISALLVNPLTQYEEWKSNRKLREQNQQCRRQVHKMPIRADGSVPICCGVYDLGHTVSQSFVDDNLEDIQRRREKYDYCSRCIKTGAHASYSVGRKNSVINRLILKDNFVGRLVRRLKHRPIEFSDI